MDPSTLGTDSDNNAIIRMGYILRQKDGNNSTIGFVAFSTKPNGEASNYFFPIDHSSEWSTWRLTTTIVKTDGLYIANVTLEINNVKVTAFVDDFDQKLSTINNEKILGSVAHHNFLPLANAGFIDQAKPLQGFTKENPSFIDNFYFGYADTIPASDVPTQLTVNRSSKLPQKEICSIPLSIAVVLTVAVAVAGMLGYLNKKTNTNGYQTSNHT